MSTYQTTRALSYLERISLSRCLTDVPPIVAFAAQIPHSGQGQIDEAMRYAVARLLKIQPWLFGAVDCRSYPPRWRMNFDLTVEDLLRIRHSDADLEELLREALQKEVPDITKGPLWQVDVAHHSNGRVVVILAMSHILADGVGVRNTMAELLSQLSRNGPVNRETMPVPLPFESTVDLKSNNIAADSSVPPKPAPLLVWPGPVKPSHVVHIRVVDLPPNVVFDIKCVAREHGVNTLHPVLHASALAALSRSSLNDADTGKAIVTNTPISLRDGALGHPMLPGNYVAELKHTYDYPLSETFWDLARKFAKDSIDSALRKKAMMDIDQLRLLPDFPPAQSPEPGVKVGDTGWERYFRGRLEAECPFSASIELSNVGLLTLPGAEDVSSAEDLRVVWAQTPPAIGASICLNLMSVKGGSFSASFTWHEGVHKESQVQGFVEAFQDILQKVGASGIPDDTKCLGM